MILEFLFISYVTYKLRVLCETGPWCFEVGLLYYRSRKVNFAFTRQAVSLLERVAVCVARNEPVLLVGETGTGKTSSVQYLAAQMGER